MRYVIQRVVLFFYGFDRCPDGQVSSVIYKLKYTDDMYGQAVRVLAYQLVFYRVLTYGCLKLKVNWSSVEVIIGSVKAMVTRVLARMFCVNMVNSDDSDVKLKYTKLYDD